MNDAVESLSSYDDFGTYRFLQTEMGPCCRALRNVPDSKPEIGNYEFGMSRESEYNEYAFAGRRVRSLNKIKNL